VDEEDLYIASQNCIEFWNVATRPVESNGLGQTIEVADRVLKRFEQVFSRLPEPVEVYDRWRELVVRFGVSGVKVHDARLVALMLANDIFRILTFNSADFQRFGELGIHAVEPGEAQTPL